MRVYALYILFAALAAYAWRDWFVSLLGLIVVTALMGHDDMPRTILGIQGLNLWNLLLVAVAIPWLLNRRAAGGQWDAPRWARVLFAIYVLVIVVAYLRALVDIRSFAKDTANAGAAYTFASLTSDHLINSLKYLVPPVMLFDGCRTRRNVFLALVATLLVAVLYSYFIIRAAPLSGLQTTGKAEMRHRVAIAKRIGFHANSAALICASGLWGVLAFTRLCRRRWHVLATLAAAALIALALALCRSRGGYLACAGVGLVFGVLLWRWLLVALPLLAVAVFAVAPGIQERVFSGVGVTDESGMETHDLDTITAGRMTDIWPPVIEGIFGSPLIGYGRLGILRTPVAADIRDNMGGLPTHPHNAYLEMLFDSGLMGFVPTIALFGALVGVAVSLSRNRDDPLVCAVGAAALAALTAFLIMGLSGQSLFPKENAQMLLCLSGISLRLWVERERISEQDACRAAGVEATAGSGVPQISCFTRAALRTP